ncbi:hypothetical protein Nepgr_026260 [Nepenthes gracilis]|uniref:Uncharacterized protein n=1 Tax=Nepenthes gracilis TaxID=150966 RepID=A0AAD3Y086_NEPGR|nr:hypothetical protein Nepgr_026260 [Nepenthes gracilis]
MRHIASSNGRMGDALPLRRNVSFQFLRKTQCLLSASGPIRQGPVAHIFRPNPPRPRIKTQCLAQSVPCLLQSNLDQRPIFISGSIIKQAHFISPSPNAQPLPSHYSSEQPSSG